MWRLLLGCAPGAFGEAQAEAAFVAMTAVNEDVWAAVWQNTAPSEAAAAAKSVTWVADDGSFSGAYEGPGSWTGAVEIDGVHGPEDDADVAWGWAMTVGYRDVRFGDARLDGDARWDVLAVYADGNATQEATLAGTLVGGGSAAGSGVVAVLSEVALVGGRYTVSVTGTVGGWSIERAYDATGFAR